MNACKIFYSWQSDMPKCRKFIASCLKSVPQALKGIAPITIDRDTGGLAGAPDIGDSIYNKIDDSSLFVADITIINKEYGGRPTPNPNVLIELGYAIRALGWDKIILVCCTDFGEIDDIPFDINHRRIAKYSFQEDKNTIRDRLTSCIKATIEILIKNHRLYGGRPDEVKARQTLTLILEKGIQDAWDSYKYHYIEEDSSFRIESFVPVTEAHMYMLETVRPIITGEQYLLLLEILNDLRKAQDGTEERSGWEFAVNVAENVYSELYLEYAKELPIIPWQYRVNRVFAELYNNLTLTAKIPYSAERKIDGRLLFVALDEKYEAYTECGKILCLLFHMENTPPYSRPPPVVSGRPQ